MIKKLAGIFTFLTITLPVAAQEPEQHESEWEKIKKGFLSSFSFPVEDLFDDNWGLSGYFSFETPLNQTGPRNIDGSERQGRRDSNMFMAANLRYNPLGHWFVSTTFYRYIFDELQAPWNPDFSYSFGYDDWNPYTFSLVYSNYTGNRLLPAKNEVFSAFDEGTWAMGWKFTLPEEIEKIFTVHETGSVGGIINYHLTPAYFDLGSNNRQNWKHAVSLGIRYVIYQWLYANITFFYYPFPGQQQPWDPDFTYGFGYSDWHPGTFSLQYNNYSGNRYPWSKKQVAGGFDLGTVSLQWSWAL